MQTVVKQNAMKKMHGVKLCCRFTADMTSYSLLNNFSKGEKSEMDPGENTPKKAFCLAQTFLLIYPACCPRYYKEYSGIQNSGIFSRIFC